MYASEHIKARKSKRKGNTKAKVKISEKAHHNSTSNNGRGGRHAPATILAVDHRTEPSPPLLVPLPQLWSSSYTLVGRGSFLILHSIPFLSPSTG